MLEFGCFSQKTKPYISHPGFANLYVLPYIRGRLVFSELVARAMEGEEFDLLAADLPHFMNDRKWLDVPLRLFPLVSSLIIKKGSSNFAFFPFVPNDAACISASLARMKFVDFDCLDDSNLINYPEGCLFQPEMMLKDDYFVFAEGLGGYFSPLWDRMEALWQHASCMQQYFTSYRASLVAGRLMGHLSRGEKTLFVCEYRLWWSVRKCLEERVGNVDPPPAPLKWEDRDAAFVIEDPYLFWVKGLLDDYPFINLQFCKSLQEREVLSFDKLDALKEVLADILSPEALPTAGNPSIRLLMTFERFLRTRVISYKRVIPIPTTHLFESARSCVGREFSRELARRLLRYPFPAILKAKDIPVMYIKIKPDIVVIGGDVFELPDIFCSTPDYWDSSRAPDQFTPGYDQEGRRYWVDDIHPYMTRQETRQMEDGGQWIRWAVEADYRIHEQACSYVRGIRRKEMHKVRIERSWGTLGDGIHWRTTIYARARGENAIYIKRKLRKKQRTGRLSEYTPIVFLFSEDIDGSTTSTIHDSNITQRNMELQNEDFPYEKYPAPDMVYSIFMTSKKETENLWGFHVQRESLTSIAFLFTRFLMGVERYKAITRRPRKFQCRVEPLNDDELQRFPLAEIGVAWAVKYAEDVVIVVAYSGWKPSGKLLRFAKERHMEIMTIPLSIFSQAMIKRLRHIYFTSTPMKKHPEREKILKRFLH